jgi:N-acetylneuraminate synthase
LRFLDEELDVKRIKLGSGELTNAPLLLAAGRTGKPVILSTGMGTMQEVEAALGPLAVGYLGGDVEPGTNAFTDATSNSEGRAILQERVTLLHCTTAYPTPPGDANLNAMATMRDKFAIPVGYSDHTEGIAVSVAASALGATIVEKHITLDRGLPGPDHRASIEPDELKAMVAAIRTVNEAMGDGAKAPRESEVPNIAVARKSLVAVAPIKSGEPFTRDNLGVKRPGTGLSPFCLWNRLGTQADRDYDVDDIIR